MKIYETYRLESVVLEMQSGAKMARSFAAIEAEKHGEVSMQGQRYAFEACAYEDCAHKLQRALDEMPNNPSSATTRTNVKPI